MKLVVNKDWGGFGLSQTAYKRLIELGVPVVDYDLEEDETYPEEVIFQGGLSKSLRGTKFDREYWDTWTCDNRSHPLVVQVVEELGDEASGPLSCLRIVEIPDDVDFYISDYDGVESVHETHRSW